MDKSQFFYRTVVFSENRGEVSLADVNNPNLATPLEPWFALIIPLADGQHTLGELIENLSLRYQDNVPANLEETISSVIDRLIEGELIRTAQEVVTLPYYLAQPIEHLDLEKAKQLMKEDGYTMH